jgi:uncharacterized membrane protein YphA (DoxX/SURF4 family)
VTRSSRASSESRTRAPEAGLAALRVVVGLWFLKGVVTKLGVVLVAGFLPLPGASARWVDTMPKLLARYAAGNPIAAYKHFLLDTVIPHGHLFANLTALGESAVGLGLTFGLLTVLASVIGLCLVVPYGLATFWQSPNQVGFHVLLFACLVVFIAVRAGRYWGLDGWVRDRYARSWLARIPLG